MKITVRPGERLKGLNENALAQFGQEMRQVAGRTAERLAEAARAEVRSKARQQTGQLESSINHFSYAGRYGVGAYVGWERTPLKRKGSYEDASGRIRKVSTVADVGRILEYSQTRKLRHIKPAYAAKENELAEHIEHEIDSFLDRIGLSE